MPIKLTPQPEFTAAREDLSLSAKIALRFVLADIKANPDHPRAVHVTFTVPGFSDRIIVVENGDLRIAYHRVGPRELSLDELIDRKNPPPWYSDE